MSNKKNNDEYFFDDEELDAFASDLSDGNSGEDEELVIPPESSPESEADLEYNVEAEASMHSEIDPDDFQEEGDEVVAADSPVGKIKEFASNNSRMLIVLGVVVVAFIGIRFLFGPTDEDKLMSAPVQKTVIQKQAPIQVSAPVATQLPSGASKQELNSVSSEVRVNKSGLRSLQSALNSIASRQTETTNALTQLTMRLQAMETTNQQLSDRIHMIEKKAADKKKKEAYKKQHYVRYQVQALEFGRAWLMGSNGLTETVSVGSVLPHYGSVLAIDIDNGEVVTSKGGSIKYGLSEMSSAHSK